MKKMTKFFALCATGFAVTLFVAMPLAKAKQTRVGAVDILYDTTVTFGVSMRVADRENRLLPTVNGGPIDTRVLVHPIIRGIPGGTVAEPSESAKTSGSIFLPQGADNFDASINADDGRLNFDSGSLTGGVVKMVNDIEMSWRNYRLFTRVSSFYDMVLNNTSRYERSFISKSAKSDTARHVDLLDFYISGDYTLGDVPLLGDVPVNVRLGKQVVNWGEGTFLLNGISSINPIDVGAFRRPGSEIKEALLPVWGAHASIGLPADLTLELFYQLAWDRYKIDRAGTPFGNTDTLAPGSTLGGNVLGSALIGGSRTAGTYRRNCDTGIHVGAGLVKTIAEELAKSAPCTVDSQYHFTTNIPLGKGEETRFAMGDLTAFQRLQDKEAKDSGQYGVALRWYSEALNSTEFGFYFLNYHSRLPIASWRAIGTPKISMSVVGAAASKASRGVPVNACTTFGLNLGNVLGSGAKLGFMTKAEARTAAGAVPALAGLGTDTIQDGTPTANAELDDPQKFMERLTPVANQVINVSGLSDADKTKAMNIVGGKGIDGASSGLVNIQRLAYMNCLLISGQVQVGVPDPDDGTTSNLLKTGAQYLIQRTQYGLRAEYPENIRLMGMSFNTTLGTWGIQGEFSYRDNQPFQLDTDAMTIGTAAVACAWSGTGDLQTIFESQVTLGTKCDPSNYRDVDVPGYVRANVYTGQIGTTATWANSNSVMQFLGADLGILLTEAGFVYVPDVPNHPGPAFATFRNSNNGKRWASKCTSGSDLPLGGILDLDYRSPGVCNPTTMSYGYVLYGRLDYNNAFGTAITLSPSVAWSHGVKGKTPSPLSNYTKGNKALSVGVQGTYQSTWKANLSYTDYMGRVLYNSNVDKDFVSLSVSYAF